MLAKTVFGVTRCGFNDIIQPVQRHHVKRRLADVLCYALCITLPVTFKQLPAVFVCALAEARLDLIPSAAALRLVLLHAFAIRGYFIGGYKPFFKAGQIVACPGAVINTALQVLDGVGCSKGRRISRCHAAYEGSNVRECFQGAAGLRMNRLSVAGQGLIDCPPVRVKLVIGIRTITAHHAQGIPFGAGICPLPANRFFADGFKHIADHVRVYVGLGQNVIYTLLHVLGVNCRSAHVLSNFSRPNAHALAGLVCLVKGNRHVVPQVHVHDAGYIVGNRVNGVDDLQITAGSLVDRKRAALTAASSLAIAYTHGGQPVGVHFIHLIKGFLR